MHHIFKVSSCTNWLSIYFYRLTKTLITRNKTNENPLKRMYIRKHLWRISSVKVKREKTLRGKYNPITVQRRQFNYKERGRKRVTSLHKIRISPRNLVQFILYDTSLRFVKKSNTKFHSKLFCCCKAFNKLW